MNANATEGFDVEDVEYLRVGDRPLLARLYKPHGKGPFPALVEVHGGAWCFHDRTRDAAINELLAKNGILVAAVDFRMPPEAPYPASMADIHYGVRWLKVHASEFGSRADLVGILGSSSGGHQAMLLGMRPRDPRYAAHSLPAGSPDTDATVRYAVLCWPVIDPLERYRYAKHSLQHGSELSQKHLEGMVSAHDRFWLTEDAMAEGNPVLALQRGEKTEMPPVLYIQSAEDQAHPLPSLDQFVALYRKAGGELKLQLAENVSKGLRRFIAKDPTSPASIRSMEEIVAFVRKHSR